MTTYLASSMVIWPLSAPKGDVVLPESATWKDMLLLLSPGDCLIVPRRMSLDASRAASHYSRREGLCLRVKSESEKDAKKRRDDAMYAEGIPPREWEPVVAMTRIWRIDGTSFPVLLQKPEPRITARYETGVPIPERRNLHAMLRGVPLNASLLVENVKGDSIKQAAHNVGKELGCRFTRRKTGPHEWRVWRLPA